MRVSARLSCCTRRAVGKTQMTATKAKTMIAIQRAISTNVKPLWEKWGGALRETRGDAERRRGGILTSSSDPTVHGQSNRRFRYDYTCSYWLNCCRRFP